VGTRVDNHRLRNALKDQRVIDLVNLDKSKRPAASAYEGICW